MGRRQSHLPLHADSPCFRTHVRCSLFPLGCSPGPWWWEAGRDRSGLFLAGLPLRIHPPGSCAAAPPRSPASMHFLEAGEDSSNACGGCPGLCAALPVLPSSSAQKQGEVAWCRGPRGSPAHQAMQGIESSLSRRRSGRVGEKVQGRPGHSRGLAVRGDRAAPRRPKALPAHGLSSALRGTRPCVQSASLTERRLGCGVEVLTLLLVTFLRGRETAHICWLAPQMPTAAEAGSHQLIRVFLGGLSY